MRHDSGDRSFAHALPTCDAVFATRPHPMLNTVPSIPWHARDYPWTCSRLFWGCRRDVDILGVPVRPLCSLRSGNGVVSRGPSALSTHARAGCPSTVESEMQFPPDTRRLRHAPQPTVIRCMPVSVFLRHSTFFPLALLVHVPVKQTRNNCIATAPADGRPSSFLIPSLSLGKTRRPRAAVGWRKTWRLLSCSRSPASVRAFGHGCGGLAPHVCPPTLRVGGRSPST